MSIFFLVCVVLSVDIPLCPSASKEKKKENFPPREGEENDLGGRALGSFVAHEQENEAPRKRQPNLFLFFFVFLKRPWPPSKNRPSLFFFKRSRKERKKKKKQMGMKGTRVFCRFKWKKRSFRRCALRITHHQPGGLVSRGYCVRDTHTHNEKNKSVVRHERKENGTIYFLKIKKKKKRDLIIIYSILYRGIHHPLASWHIYKSEGERPCMALIGSPRELFRTPCWPSTAIRLDIPLMM